MKNLKCFTAIGIIFVLITGSLAHFLYDWSKGNLIIGLFTPVNESIWEHMKLLFFPMLLYAIAAIPKMKTKYPCMASSLCFGILAGTALIPVLYYIYTSLLHKNIFLLDISTFILSTAIAFLIAHKLTLSCKLEPYTTLLWGLVTVLFLCFILFTYHPPNLKIFADPSGTTSSIAYDNIKTRLGTFP